MSDQQDTDDDVRFNELGSAQVFPAGQGRIIALDNGGNDAVIVDSRVKCEADARLEGAAQCHGVFNRNLLDFASGNVG